MPNNTPLGDSRSVGKLRLARLGEVTEAADERLADLRPRFDRLRRDESAPRVVSAFNLFQTPEPLAGRLAELAALDQLTTAGRVLEPSAGLGRLYRAVRRFAPSAPVVLVDNAPECCGELYRATTGDPAASLVQADFLDCTAERLGGRFDRVVMNPPFKQGRDIRHILHAAALLAPGGLLVALCADGPRQNAKLRPHATTWQTLPPASFASEGTRVATALLTIEAPPAAGRPAN